MKALTLWNLYTRGFRVKKVENNFPVKMGQVISFDEDADKDYKLYRVMRIKKEK